MKKILLGFTILVTFTFIISNLPLGLGLGMGSTGIRPKTHGCLGIILDRNIVHRIMPSARIEFLSFAYYVNKDKMSDWESNYCLGKDIWYGE